MIHIFLVENCPWCYWASLNWKDYATWGEWAWVGREYRDDILPRWSSIGGRE